MSRVLVCIYTPNLFSKEKTHEYCAKEFDAFLKRQRKPRYEEVIHNGTRVFRVRDARNIVPILWVGEADLLPQGLPPPRPGNNYLHVCGTAAARLSDQQLTSALRWSHC
jgi:hypothetical protein